MSIIAQVEIFLVFGLVTDDGMFTLLYIDRDRSEWSCLYYIYRHLFKNYLNIFECNFGTTYRKMITHILNNSSFLANMFTYNTIWQSALDVYKLSNILLIYSRLIYSEYQHLRILTRNLILLFTFSINGPIKDCWVVLLLGTTFDP